MGGTSCHYHVMRRKLRQLMTQLDIVPRLEPSHLTVLASGFLLSAKYAVFTDHLGRVLQSKVFTIGF